MDVGTTIRKHRLRMRLRLKDVADECGFTVSLLSKIENGKAVPPVATLSRIAAVLNLPISALLAEPGHASTVFVPNEDTRDDALTATDAGYRFVPLASKRPTKLMQPLIFEAESGQVDRPRTLRHPGEEFVFVLTGRMNYRVGATTYRMGPGDSIYFDAEQDHAVEPISKPVRYLAIFVEDIGRGTKDEQTKKSTSLPRP